MIHVRPGRHARIRARAAVFALRSDGAKSDDEILDVSVFVLLHAGRPRCHPTSKAAANKVVDLLSRFQMSIVQCSPRELVRVGLVANRVPFGVQSILQVFADDAGLNVRD